MKILLVDNGILGEVIEAIIIISSKIPTIRSSHEDALENFLLEDPDRVLIFESWSEKKELSITTATDIRNSATSEIIIKTIGFDKEKDLVLPVELNEILQAINLV